MFHPVVIGIASLVVPLGNGLGVFSIQRVLPSQRAASRELLLCWVSVADVVGMKTLTEFHDYLRRVVAANDRALTNQVQNDGNHKVIAFHRGGLNAYRNVLKRFEEIASHRPENSPNPQ